MLFVARTNRGSLDKELRKRDEELCSRLGKRIKVVDRGGTMLKSLLCKCNPWDFLRCHRPDCIPCEDAIEGKPSGCSRRNIVYQNQCEDCKSKGKEVLYLAGP